MLVQSYDDTGQLTQSQDFKNLPSEFARADQFTTLTRNEFQQLVLSSALSPGNWYYITDATPSINGYPIKVYLFAENTNQLEFEGFGEYAIGIGNYYIQCKVKYNCNQFFNNVVYIEDSKNNKVHGINNISNFPWGSFICSDNYVDSTSQLVINPSTVFTEFRNNRVENYGFLSTDATSSFGLFVNNIFRGNSISVFGGVVFTGFTSTTEFCNNHILQNNITLSGTFDYFNNNTIRDCTVGFYIDPTTSISNFNYNFFETSIIDIRCSGTDFLRNTFKNSTCYLLNSSLEFKDNSIIENSNFQIDASSTVPTVLNNKFSTSVCNIGGSSSISNFQDNDFIGDFTFYAFSCPDILSNKFHLYTITNGYLEGAISGGMYYNDFNRGAIYTYAGNPITIGGAVQYNTVVRGGFNITGVSMSYISQNICIDSIVTTTSTSGSASYSGNYFNYSYLGISNDTSLTNCKLEGVVNPSGTELDTGVTYDSCIYKFMDFSTFWAEYDFTVNTIFSGVTFTIPLQHSNIIGIYVAKNAVGAPDLDIIQNFPTYHKFRLRSGNNEVRVTNNASIVLPTAYTSPIRLGQNFPNYDYVEFDNRQFPFGGGTGSPDAILVDSVIF